MTVLPANTVAFSITVNTITDGPFSLYSLLSTGVAPTGTTLAAALSATFTGKPVATLVVQNDNSNAAGNLVYIGDSTLSSTNHGQTITVGQSLPLNPGRGSNAWMNGIYFNASSNSTVINFTVLYG